jgi:hypothetical protein
MADFYALLRQAGTSILSQAKQAAQWFGQQVKDITKNPNNLFKRNSFPKIGNMYLFVYDPKLKATLPFYDAYPLVIPIEYYSDGFLGLNLHYLPPMGRAALLDALTALANNNKYDETTKLNISYKMLKSYSIRFSGYQNCVKRYLFGYVRSSFHYVNPADWNKVVLMPLQKWVVNSDKRYADSPPY